MSKARLLFCQHTKTSADMQTETSNFESNVAEIPRGILYGNSVPLSDLRLHTSIICYYVVVFTP